MGTRDAPKDWIPDDLSRFKRYAKKLHEVNYSEFALPFEMMVEHLRQGGVVNSVNDSMITEIEDLTEGEKATFLEFIKQYQSAELISRIPDAHVKRVVERVAPFIEDYGEKIYDVTRTQ